MRVLHEIRLKHLTQVAAAKRLQVTDRLVRRLLLVLEKRGDRAVYFLTGLIGVQPELLSLQSWENSSERVSLLALKLDKNPLDRAI
jgi:hypothetical protein